MFTIVNQPGPAPGASIRYALRRHGRLGSVCRTSLLVLVACLAVGDLPARAATSTGNARKVSPYARGAMPEGARRENAITWGIDELSVKLIDSGELVRFNYRVIDAPRASSLQDRAAAPSLVDPVAHVSLVVPTMEKVGPLRQAMAAENGKSYWIAFSNKGFPVKKGHRVSVVIGSFRVDGLVVQ